MSAGVALDKVEKELKVLEDFTFTRTKTDLEGKLAEARRAEDRVKTQAEAKLVQAETDLESKELIYHQERGRKADIVGRHRGY